MSYEGRLKAREWEVRDCPMETGVELVSRYHYAKGAANTRTYLHGLYPTGSWLESDCVGVAWWIPPTKSAAEATFPENWQGVLALSRLVIAPGVPKNACSFLLSRSMKLIDRKLWPCLVTYADEWRGHVGTIYRATNWQYVGLTKPEAVYTRNGRMVARKAGPSTRTHSDMLALGAEQQGKFAKHKFIHLEVAA